MGFLPCCMWKVFWYTGFLPRLSPQDERHTQCRVEVKFHTLTFLARLLREPRHALPRLPAFFGEPCAV